MTSLYASSLGAIQVSFEGGTLMGLTFNPEAMHLKPLEDRGLQNQVEGALRHEWPQSPQMAVYGTPFQLQVWKSLSQLTPCQTTTYGHIAKALGKERGAQAVGQAVKANPLNWIIPCHRVLPAQGGIGGFRWGAEIKRHLMKKDGC
jgi:O-6-methylguanine DNA methyltransferase